MMGTIIEVKNPVWANPGHTQIDLLITDTEYGDIPFTASPHDPESHGVVLFNAAVAGEFGTIAEYVPPIEVKHIPTQVTMRQARLALLYAGLLTPVNAAIASMPGAEGDAARIEWEFAKDVDRSKPLVAAMATALNLDGAALDALFEAAAAL